MMLHRPKWSVECECGATLSAETQRWLRLDAEELGWIPDKYDADDMDLWRCPSCTELPAQLALNFDRDYDAEYEQRKDDWNDRKRNGDE